MTISCRCPVCDRQMTLYMAPLAPQGPIGRFWRCDDPECVAKRPGEVIERRWPDPPEDGEAA